MKPTFQNFIQSNPTYKKFDTNTEAKHVFDDILLRDDSLIAMIELCEQKKPALAACVLEIEDYFNKSITKSFDLEDNFTKQGLGRMVRCVLEPFGYKVCGQKDMPRALNTAYITSASTYELTGPAKLKIVKTIVEVTSLITSG